MNPLTDASRRWTRRALLGNAATGVGAAAPGSMLRGGPGGCHFAPRAKRVIYLLQNGAPSRRPVRPQADAREDARDTDPGQRGRRRALQHDDRQPKGAALPAGDPPLRQRGQSGATVSDLLLTASIADQLCFVKSMTTTQVNHAPAITYFLTGSERPGRPSMGAWLSYGLGKSCDDLPTFVAMTSRDKEASCGQMFYDYYWGSGFLPSVHQGVKFRGSGDPVLYLDDPAGTDRALRRTCSTTSRAQPTPPRAHWRP